MTTAMATALAKAGRKGPQARLEDHATEAWNDALGGVQPDASLDGAESSTQLKELAKMAIEQDPQNFQAALGLFLSRLSSDVGALTALIGGDKVRLRAGEYLHTIWLEHFGKKGVKVREHGRGLPGKKGGHSSVETQTGYAAGGGGQRSPETQSARVPAATSLSRRAAAVAAGDIVGKSWFDREIVRGRPIGDLTYDEMKRAALLSRDSGMHDLRQAYVMVRALKSVAYHPAMEREPARNWADEAMIAAADQRFAEFGHLLTGEIDSFLTLEHRP